MRIWCDEPGELLVTPVEQPTFSHGSFQYVEVEGWAKLPTEVSLGEVAAVAVDPQDRVYLFTRGPHPVIALDRDGNVLRTFGHGVFKSPHGIHVGSDGNLFCTDNGDHTVRQCTPEGRVLLEIGARGAAAPFMSGLPFHSCTHTALSPKGDIYVSDGYGNACIHKYSPDGRRLHTWGGSGCAPGEFFLPHNLVCDDAGWIHVADRENHRIQVFDGEGRYETQWNNLHRPCALCKGGDGNYYVGELGTFLAPFLDFPNLGPRLSVLDSRGQLLARLSGGPAGIGPGRFIAPHGIAVDSNSDIYLAEVSYSAWPWVFPETPRPPVVPSIRKLRRMNHAPAMRATS